MTQLPNSTQLLNKKIMDNHFYLKLDNQDLSNFKIKNHKFFNLDNPFQKNLTPNLSIAISEIINEKDDTIPLIIFDVIVFNDKGLVNYIESFLIPLLSEQVVNHDEVIDKHTFIIDIPHQNELLTQSSLWVSVKEQYEYYIETKINDNLNLFDYTNDYLSENELSIMIDKELKELIHNTLTMCYKNMKCNLDIECHQSHKRYEETLNKTVDLLKTLIE